MGSPQGLTGNRYARLRETVVVRLGQRGRSRRGAGRLGRAGQLCGDGQARLSEAAWARLSPSPQACVCTEAGHRGSVRRSHAGSRAEGAVFISNIPGSTRRSGEVGSEGLVFTVRCCVSEVTRATFSHTRTGQWSHGATGGQDVPCEGVDTWGRCRIEDAPASFVCQTSGWSREVRSLGWGQEPFGQPPRMAVPSSSRTVWHHLQGGSVLSSRQSRGPQAWRLPWARGGGLLGPPSALLCYRAAVRGLLPRSRGAHALPALFFQTTGPAGRAPPACSASLACGALVCVARHRLPVTAGQG